MNDKIKKPNFLVIGANKSGTTSFHEYLSQHPEIFMSAVKEPMFFTAAPKRPNVTKEEYKTIKNTTYDLESYLALFQNVKNEKAIGESSTAYLANPSCAKRIHSFDPQMKLIAIIRNPIDRAFSNYLMYKRWGFETKSFQDAIKDEMKGKPVFPQGKQYLRLSQYSESLSTFYDYFPKSAIRVFLFDELINNDMEVLQEAFRFLGVQESVKISTRMQHNNSSNAIYRNGFTWMNKTQLIKHRVLKYSPGWIKKELLKKPKIDEQSKHILLKYFYRDILDTGKLIQRDLSSWLVE